MLNKIFIKYYSIFIIYKYIKYILECHYPQTNNKEA